jgi:hypothetical protein
MEDPIISVQQMDQLASGALETSIKVPNMANVLVLAKKGDPPGSKLRDNSFRRVLCGTVVDYLNLHDFRPRVLKQHAFQSLAKEGGTIV